MAEGARHGSFHAISMPQHVVPPPNVALASQARSRFAVYEMAVDYVPPPQRDAVARRNGINPNQLFHWRKLSRTTA